MRDISVDLTIVIVVILQQMRQVEREMQDGWMAEVWLVRCAESLCCPFGRGLNRLEG